jgi:hypothetical protein
MSLNKKSPKPPITTPPKKRIISPQTSPTIAGAKKAYLIAARANRAMGIKKEG